MFEVLDFAGRTIAGQDDLLVSLVERVEGVEEFLLNTLFAGEELDVVDKQDVGLAIFFPEPDELVILNGVDVFVGEFLRRQVSDARALLVTGDVLADCVQQVGLAEPDAAVEKEGIVGFARRLRDGLRGGVGEIVVVANDKCFKRVLRIEAQLLNQANDFRPSQVVQASLVQIELDGQVGDNRRQLSGHQHLIPQRSQQISLLGRDLVRLDVVE